MIYITGDTHGGVDMTKLDSDHFKEQLTLTKADYLIVAGDFGFIWQNNEKQKEWLSLFRELPYTTLFVDGNHENFDLLNTYPEEVWSGGRIHRIHDSLFHLMRGQVFSIDGKTIFTFGGGKSVDRAFRRPYISWWPDEMPSSAEYQQGLQNLERCNWKVDHVITHVGPARIIETFHQMFSPDSLTAYLQAVSERLDFTKWYFAHYHLDRIVSDNYRALYQDVIPLGD